MKKNLSSQAIKAMAIGMAFSVTSTTITSGINVYADSLTNEETTKNNDISVLPAFPSEEITEDFPVVLPELPTTEDTPVVLPSFPSEENNISTPILEEENEDENKEEKLVSKEAPKTNDIITITTSTVVYTFKVLEPDTTHSMLNNEGSVALTSITNKSKLDEAPNNFIGTLDDSSGVLVKVTDEPETTYTFKITQIGDGTNSIAKGLTIKDTDINKVLTTDLAKISTSAFNGVTIDGNLTFKAANLSENDDIGANAFQNAHIKGDLDFSKLSPQKIDLSNDPFKANATNKGIIVDGTLKVYDENAREPRPQTHTVSNGEFEGITVGDFKIALSDNEDVENLFKNATIGNNTTKEKVLVNNIQKHFNKSNFSGATINGIINIKPFFDGDFTAKESSFENATVHKLNIVVRQGKTNNFKSNTNTFKNATIENLDITLGGDSNGTATFSQDGFFKGSTIKNLGTNITSATSIPDNTFKGATLPNNITLSAVTSIGDFAFDIANTTPVNIYLPEYTSSNNIDANAFGSKDSKAKINLILPLGTTERDITSLKTKLNNKNVTIKTQAQVTNDNGTYIFEEIVTIDKKEEKNGQVVLVGYNEPIKENKTLLDNGDKFEKGVLTFNTKKYDLTKVGNGTDALTTISDEALKGHTDKVTTISDNAFKGTTNITSISLPAVTTVGNSAFENSTVISVSLPKVTNINDNTFKGTTKLASVSLDAVTSLGSSAFENSNITSVSLPNVTSVNDNAFKNSNLTSVSLPEANTIGNNAFDGTKVTNINLPSVNTIGDSAFANTNSLNKVELPKVENVGNNAFSNSSVVNADLGSQVPNDKPVNIPNNAFTGSSNLGNISTNGNPTSKNNATNSAQNSNSNNIVVDSGGSETIVKPDGSGNGGSGSGSSGSSTGGSSGGSSGGGGANIGTTNTNNSSTENNTNTNTENNNNNNNSTVVEDKTLGLDVISLPSVTGEPKVFVDVANNHWAKSHIDKLSTAGIINGDQNGNFNLNGQTKRADVTIMLVKLLGLTPETNTKFNDVDPNAYYAAYVGAASNYGIVNGSNGNFNPNGIISRQDTMVMIAQILKGLNLNVNTDTSNLTQFSDVSKISPYANESVAILVNSGIITGNNGKLNPTAPVTRAEMATIMSKLYDVLASAK